MLSTTNNYILGSGKVYFDQWDPTTLLPTGERYLGSTQGFEIGVTVQKIEHWNNESGLAEKDLEVVTRINRMLTLTVDNASDENFALFLMASNATITQTATPVVKEVITTGKMNQDRWYQIGASIPAGVQNISAVTVYKNDGTTVVVAGDYTLDLVNARIYIKTGAAGVANGDASIKVSYTPGASSYNETAANLTQSVTGSMRFVADNAVGVNRNVYLPKVILTPNGKIAFKGEQWVQLVLDGEILTKDSSTEAIYIDGRAA